MHNPKMIEIIQRVLFDLMNKPQNPKIRKNKPVNTEETKDDFLFELIILFLNLKNQQSMK